MGDRGEGEIQKSPILCFTYLALYVRHQVKSTAWYILYISCYSYSYSIKRALASNTHTPCAHTYHDDHVHTILPLFFPTPSVPSEQYNNIPKLTSASEPREINELPFFAMPVGVNRFHLGLAATTHNQTHFFMKQCSEKLNSLQFCYIVCSVKFIISWSMMWKLFHTHSPRKV